MPTTTQLLDRFVDLFNDNHIEELERDYASGGYAEEVGTNRRFTPAESVESGRAWRAAFPDARGTITNKIIDGNRGVAEILWRGTNTGALMNRPATGRAVTVRAVVVIETDGKLITRSTHYIDIAGLMGQLGQSVAAA
jgi:steroid delta-isomerase-like uncharacterized protein